MNQTLLEKEEVTQLLADLLFAYVNKDEDCPHGFEIEAVEKAVEYLKTEYKGNTYNQAFFERCKELVKNKY